MGGSQNSCELRGWPESQCSQVRRAQTCEEAHQPGIEMLRAEVRSKGISENVEGHVQRSVDEARYKRWDYIVC